MEMKVNVKKAALIAWFVVSVLYIAYDIYSDFRINFINVAYQNGATDAYTNIVTEANKWCSGFSVSAGDKKVDLISVSCLQQPTQTSPVPGNE